MKKYFSIAVLFFSIAILLSNSAKADIVTEEGVYLGERGNSGTFPGGVWVECCRPSTSVCHTYFGGVVRLGVTGNSQGPGQNLETDYIVDGSF
jgi:hypothetical protein